MNKRPKSITVIAWILIVACVLGLIPNSLAVKNMGLWELP
jgi:hypothetical protein